MQFEMYAHSLGSNEFLGKQRASAKRELAYEQREFYSKATQFVELWKKFAEQLNGQQTFDAKLAKKLSKAFHDLEKSEGWPVR